MKPKSTFIFAAMLGMASAVHAEEKPEPMWSIDFGSAYSGNYKAEGLDGVSIDITDVASVTETSNVGRARITAPTLGVKLGSEFTLVVTAVIAPDANLENWPVLFSIGESDAWCFKVNIRPTSHTFHFDADAGSGAEYLVNPVVDNRFVATPGLHTFVLTMQDNGAATDGNKPGLATLYVDGNLVYSQGIAAARRHDTSTLKCLSLGERITDDNNNFSGVTFNGVEMYSGAMTQAQVINYVPEPATATLSLLALAGLAARRRRK